MSGALIVPAPTLREGIWLVLLWAQFTGRAPIQAEVMPRPVGPSGRYEPAGLS